MGSVQDIEKGLDQFKALIFDNSIDAALDGWIPAVMAIPVIGYVLRKAVHVFADRLYGTLAGTVIFSTILFIDVKHREVFQEASMGLKKIAIEKGLDSPEYKEAHVKEKKALKDLIQFSAAKS